ncbi:MAG TPA: hypothetical protein VFQ39_19975, partial [Longimicrobium sp.]|nr:hypothetical protein [Longimicrobium sp.]
MRRFPLLLLPLALAALAAPAAGQRPEDYDYENLAFSGLGVWLFGVAPAKAEVTPALHVRADLGLLGP